MKQLRKAPSEPKGKEEIKVNRTLNPVKKGDDYNAEIERGEIVLGNYMGDGIPETYVSGGNKHYAGGNKVNLPDNSFIFSDDKSMKVKDEDIQEIFNKPKKKSGYTPADLAKQYNINKYRKILAEEDSDKLQKSTAEEMIKNYNEKLGMLALVQESKKGFDAGIPFVAIPYLESMGINPAEFVNSSNETTEVPDSEEVPQQKMGGQMRVRITHVPKMQQGGGINPFTSKTIAGKTTPTGENSDARFDTEWYRQHYGNIGIDVSNLGDQQAQSLLYDKADPFLKAVMWGSYGDTNKGATRDKFSKFGLLPDKDFNGYKARMTQTFGGADGLNKELGKYKNSFADGKSGIRTATLLNPLQQQEQTINAPQIANVPTTSLRTPGAIQKNQYTPPPVAEQNTPFWTEDIANVAGAFGDLNRIKKYMPWQAGFDTVLPKATFFDPTRDLAANAEQSNIAAQTLSAYAGPQALSSRLSSVQGQGLANAANILGRTNNENVGIANQNEALRAGITNQSNLQRAELATNLYDKTIAVNQEFDNAKMMARQNLRNSFVNAWTNRGKTQQLNSMNQDYRIDPNTGYVNFKPGYKGSLFPAQQRQSLADEYLNLRNSLQGTEDPDKTAADLFKIMYGK